MSRKNIFNKASAAVVGLLLVVTSNSTNDMDVEATEIASISTNEITQPKITPPPLSIFFGISEHDVPESSNQQIKDIAQYLIETGDSFEIEGCTSPDGSDNSNYALATGRAHSVLNALEAEGVPITRYRDIEGIIGQDRDIYGTGEGECAPLVNGLADTDEQSRRANVNLNPNYQQDPPEPREPSEFEKGIVEFGEDLSETLKSIDGFFSSLSND
ncbi:MAG: hypothetical protein COB36_01925 [Alphaproteobacteria bacterium]|nr:MAG: hypothetical protein COB36_01925 [Alphaproteobacteria bacterium]